MTVQPHQPPLTYGLVPPAIAAADGGLAFLQAVINRVHPAPPFAESTSIWMTSAEKGRVVFEAHPSSKFLNPLGSVHGGWVSTLLDSAMGCAVHSTLLPGHGYTTVDMTVTFVRAVRPDSGPLTCEGKIVHAGGRIATAEGRIHDAQGRLIAHGTETCMILRAPTSATAPEGEAR
jgi:uncharacterized protein (TIGR00369 family)